MNVDRQHDGFFHPAGEDEVIALVKQARREGKTLRVRGSGHAVAHAIYTDPLSRFGKHGNRIIEPGPPHPTHDGAPVKALPAGGNFDLLLDVAPSYTVICEECRLIEVDAGMQMSGLLQRLSGEHGWMLAGTGGIAHQTVAGFVATASAGGSLTHSINDSISGFRFVDGTGRARDVKRGDDEFAAMVPNLGLMGVVTKVRFCCVPDFIVDGSEATSRSLDAQVVLQGAVGADQRSLRDFLENTPFARVEWWPQRHAERVIAWGARPRMVPVPFPCDEQVPYRLFARLPRLAQLAFGAAYTLMGNLDDMDRAKHELTPMIAQARKDEGLIDELLGLMRTIEPGGGLLADFIEHVHDDNTAAITGLPTELFRHAIPRFFPKLLDTCLPVHDGTIDVQEFRDYAWRSLPMDNTVDDVYMPVAFTEFWVPMKCLETVMKLLHDHFGLRPGGPKVRRSEAYRRTGVFTFEVYATKPNDFWLNPAYSNGRDDWVDGAFRMNPFWYSRNADDPATDFFAQFWKLLGEAGVPYRLHWGKFLPLVALYPGWVEHIKDQYPCWDKFMELRKERDPDGIFLNQYWRDHLGIQIQS